LPKAATAILTQGAQVFWDATASNMTSVSRLNYPIGVATAAAASGGATLSTRLDGIAIVAEA